MAKPTPLPDLIEEPDADEEVLSSEGEDESQHLTSETDLGLLPLRDTVVFPGIVLPVMVGRAKSRRLIESVYAGDDDDKLLAVVTLKDATVEDPTIEDFYSVGTLVRIIQMFKLPDGNIRVVIEGIERIKLEHISDAGPFFTATVLPLQDTNAHSAPAEAMLRSVLGAFQRMVTLAPYLPEQLIAAAMNVSDPAMLADFMAANVNIDVEGRQELLETADVVERLERVLRILSREVELLEMGTKINEQIQGEFDSQQREFMLRRQLEAIKKELGEDDASNEFADLRRQLEEKDLPEEAKTEAMRELGRLESIPSVSPEHSVIRGYLDWMIAMPWGDYTKDSINVRSAKRILDQDHYGLDKPKDRVLEYLSVRQLKSDLKGPILCFVGPPGVGKTSLGQSIARALGRNFVRMSLGGVHDEAELRGHRRTYIGAMPGRIVSALRRAGSMNPVIMLDEVDKLGADYRGDPAAALLEVLDPAQNNTFRDHYLDVPLDLSSVLFIATANISDTIPGPLFDRMEVINIPGYTEVEKAQIAKKFLLPKQLEAHGLTTKEVKVKSPAIKTVITKYTREAGVRSLDRTIATLLRKTARQIVEGAETPINIGPNEVYELLGPERIEAELGAEKDEVGLATGLAWTPYGGDVLFIEATVMPGTGKLILTGQLGDVMQESAQAALTYARHNGAQWGLGDDWAEKHDVHIHVPAGAIPKDGPSAGITMTTSLVSALTDRPVRRSMGMTGEVTLRGKVLPIGGLKEKILAAHRTGLKSVLIPKQNQKDLIDIPEFVRKDIDLVLVEDVSEVLDRALLPTVKAKA